MLYSRQVLSTIHRNFSDKKNHFRVQTLFHPDNRNKCLDQMKLITNSSLGQTKKTSVTAAVLILLVKCDKPDDEPAILYTLRSNKLRKHVRQVSFPGGILEGNDASYADCALRETYEEIGIPTNRVTLWGETSLIRIRNSPTIMPVVGSISNYQCDQLNLNTDEVERVFTVPISKLCEQRRHTQFRIDKQNISNNERMNAYSIPVFTTNEERIWGITAIITHIFLHSLLPKNLYSHRIPFISKYR